MAVKKKEKAVECDEQDATVRRGIEQAVHTLFTRHAPEIARVRRESELDRVIVTFRCDIDNSESEPSLRVGIRYGQTYTDNLVSRIPNANQEEFEFMSLEQARAEAAESSGDEKGILDE